MSNFRNKRQFFVCSYGGCGTMMLARRLNNYGIVRIVHSNKPPKKLETLKQYFFSGIEMDQEEIDRTTVIYIYKNPVNAIYSRYISPALTKFFGHECTFNDLIEQETDVFKLEEFFDAYTCEEPDRNYRIICVKYSEMFEKEEELCKVLNIDKLNLEKKEKQREQPHKELIEKIYKNLNEKINNMPFIKII